MFCIYYSLSNPPSFHPILNVYLFILLNGVLRGCTLLLLVTTGTLI